METVVVVNSDEMGHGDAALGARLLGSLLRTFSSVDPKPGAVVFYNGAVRVLAQGSPLLTELNELHGHGVDLLACVTCLEHFRLADRLAVGQVSNMREIATRLMRAAKVVTV